MDLNTVIYIVINIIAIGIIYGTIKTQIKYIEKSIDRLEKKQDKHNDVITRMFVCEEKLKEQKEIIQEIKNN